MLAPSTWKIINAILLSPFPSRRARPALPAVRRHVGCLPGGPCDSPWARLSPVQGRALNRPSQSALFAISLHSHVQASVLTSLVQLQTADSQIQVPWGVTLSRDAQPNTWVSRNLGEELSPLTFHSRLSSSVSALWFKCGSIDWVSELSNWLIYSCCAKADFGKFLCLPQTVVKGSAEHRSWHWRLPDPRLPIGPSILTFLCEVHLGFLGLIVFEVSRTDHKPWIRRTYLNIATEIIADVSPEKHLKHVLPVFWADKDIPLFLLVLLGPLPSRWISLRGQGGTDHLLQLRQTECGLWGKPESLERDPSESCSGQPAQSLGGIFAGGLDGCHPLRRWPLQHCTSSARDHHTSPFRSQSQSAWVPWRFPEGGPRGLRVNPPRTLNGNMPDTQREPGAPCLGKRQIPPLVPWNLLSRLSSCSTSKTNTLSRKTLVSGKEGCRERWYRLFRMSEQKETKKTFILVSPF